MQPNRKFLALAATASAAATVALAMAPSRSNAAVPMELSGAFAAHAAESGGLVRALHVFEEPGFIRFGAHALPELGDGARAEEHVEERASEDEGLAERVCNAVDLADKLADPAQVVADEFGSDDDQQLADDLKETLESDSAGVLKLYCEVREGF